jgi:hypothetical protein
MRDVIFILHIAFVDGFGVNSQENDSCVWIHGVGALLEAVLYACALRLSSTGFPHVFWWKFTRTWFVD